MEALLGLFALYLLIAPGLALVLVLAQRSASREMLAELRRLRAETARLWHGGGGPLHSSAQPAIPSAPQASPSEASESIGPTDAVDTPVTPPAPASSDELLERWIREREQAKPQQQEGQRAPERVSADETPSIGDPTPSPSTAPASVSPLVLERWLGVRGAGLLGAIAAALAGILLFRHAMEVGWITPAMRVGAGIAGGIGLVLWGEWLRPRGYRWVPEGLLGAGVVALYAALWAATQRYALWSGAISFPAMGLVTLVLCMRAVQHQSQTAVALALVGGFATPLLLATDEDRPLLLFGYLLLLNLGLALVGRRVGGTWLGAAALAATFLVQVGWILTRLDPDEELLCVAMLGAFGLLFALASPGGHATVSARVTRFGGLLAPIVLALYLVQRADLDGSLWAYVGLLAVLLGAALWTARGPATKHLCVAVAGASAALVLGAVGDSTESPSDGVAKVLALPLLSLLAHVGAIAMAWLRERSADRERYLCGLVLLVATPFAAIAVLLHPHPDLVWHLSPIAIGSVVGLCLSRASLRPRLVSQPPRPMDPLEVPLLAVLAAALALVLWEGRLSDVGLDGVPRGAVYGAAGLLLALLPWQWLWRGEVLRQRFGDGAWAASAVSLLWFGCASVGSSDSPGSAGAWNLGALVVAGILLGLSAAGSPRPLGSALGAAVWLAAALGVSWSRALVAPAWPTASTALSALYFAGITAVAWTVAIAPALGARRAQVVHPSAWWLAALALPAAAIALFPGARWLGGREGEALLCLALAGAAALSRFALAPGLAQGRWLHGAACAGLGAAALALWHGQHVPWIGAGWFALGLGLWLRSNRHLLPALVGAVVPAVLAIGLGWVFFAGPPWARPEIRWFHSLGLVHLLALLGALATAFGILPLARARAELRSLGLVPVGAAVVVGFLWISLAVLESPGSGGSLGMTEPRSPRLDLALSLAWAIYGLGLLVAGLLGKSKGPRWASLAILLVSILKVFLGDLGHLEGLARVGSLSGLAVSLTLVSLLYQRFVFRREPLEPRDGSRPGSAPG